MYVLVMARNEDACVHTCASYLDHAVLCYNDIQSICFVHNNAYVKNLIATTIVAIAPSYVNASDDSFCYTYYI